MVDRVKVGEWPFRLRDRLSGLDEHDVGGPPQGLEFTVEGDATDAINAGDASAPNKAEHQLRVANVGEGLSDHNATSASVRQSHTASSMNVLSPDKRDRTPRPVSTCQTSVFSRHSPAPRFKVAAYPLRWRRTRSSGAKRTTAPRDSTLSTLTPQRKSIGGGSAAQADPFNWATTGRAAADRVAGLISEAGAGCDVRLGLAECSPGPGCILWPVGANSLLLAIDRRRHGGDGSTIPMPASVSMTALRRPSRHAWAHFGSSQAWRLPTPNGNVGVSGRSGPPQ